MQALKKIEIILGAPELPRLARLLEKHGLAYTVYHHVTGRGDRGVRGDDDLTGVFSNICLMTACPAEQLSTVVESVRPLLKKTGGLCLVSEVQSVIH
jgi:nitrogen regulatory protein PII